MAHLDSAYSLLGDLSGVPPDYIRDVAHTKRFMECWIMDPVFRGAFEKDPETALGRLGLCLAKDQVLLFTDENSAAKFKKDFANGRTAGYPSSAIRYQAFLDEKVSYRKQIRRNGESTSSPQLTAWRRRQANRCRGQLGSSRSEAIVHAPAAIELSTGCTVGCWFCGVAAPKFDHAWRYTESNASLWKTTLALMGDLIGPSAQKSPLYWATDPLDNPDYERFLADFHEIIGGCPQTTTAIAHRDFERTRQLLELSHSMGSVIDRFSIIALNLLHQVHEAMSPEELLRVECLPLNREAGSRYRKSNAGRARKFARKRAIELTSAEESATIACVSGFLLNMSDQSVRLITPCNASDRWPLGYWVLDQGSFSTSGELEELLRTMIAENMPMALCLHDVVRLRSDLRVEVDGGDLRLLSLGDTLVISGQPDADAIAELITEGSATVEGTALERERRAGIPLPESFALLDRLFDEGMLDEEPALTEAPAFS
jgi:radical SAM family RiPP maturation amino acid epimerase